MESHSHKDDRAGTRWTSPADGQMNVSLWVGVLLVKPRCAILGMPRNTKPNPNVGVCRPAQLSGPITRARTPYQKTELVYFKPIAFGARFAIGNQPATR